MIALSPVLFSPTSPAAPTAAVSEGATATAANTFGQTLVAFLDASDVASASAMLSPAAVERQGLADDGKGLPTSASQNGDGDDRAGTASGAASAWFPTFILPAPQVSATVDPAAPSPDATLNMASATANAPTASLTALAQPTISNTLADIEDPKQRLAPPFIATATPLHAPPIVRPESRVPTQAAGERSSDPRPVTSVAMPIIVASLTTSADAASATPTVAAVTRAVAPATLTNAPEPTKDALRPAIADTSPIAPVRADFFARQAITVSAIPQPAAQIFAAAIATATSWRVRSTRIAERESVDLAPALPVTATAIDDRAIAQPTGNAQNAALDLTRNSGLQHMIDRIETLRDDVDSQDTRVRLTPDALGSVDIAVRHDGDRVHVRFTAEQDATRALIADAQPRLSELAAARGVRIGETSVGTGAGGTGTPQQPQANPRVARAPVAAATETDSTTTTDQRLA